MGETVKSVVLEKTIKTSPGTPVKKRAGAFIKGAILAIALVPVALVALELLCRAAHLGEEEYLKVDPVLGYTHLENQQITFRSEGYSSQRTNAAGMFDVARSVAKPPGVTRIAILGDSNVEALQVPFKSWFGRLLENRLNAGLPTRKFEVLNFGMGGYSTGQEYYQWLRDVAGYEPDITIVCFHALDSGENVPPGSQEPSPRPYFKLSAEGKLSCDWSYLDKYLSSDNARFLSKIDWLRRNCRLWGVIAKTDMNMAGNKYYKPLHDFCSKLMPKSKGLPLEMVQPEREVVTALDQEHSSVDKMPYHPARKGVPGSEFDVYQWATESNFNVTAAIMRRFSHACRAQGSRLIVAPLPAPNNMFFYLQEIANLKKLGAHEGFEVVNINDAFPSLAPTQESPLFYHIHFSPAGHKVVADTLYNHLAATGQRAATTRVEAIR